MDLTPDNLKLFSYFLSKKLSESDIQSLVSKNKNLLKEVEALTFEEILVLISESKKKSVEAVPQAVKEEVTEVVVEQEEEDLDFF